MPISAEFIALGALVFIVLILTLWVIRLEVRLRRFTRGKRGASLEDAIGHIGGCVDQALKRQEETDAFLRSLSDTMKRTVQGVGTIRFNPFKGTSGSNQSFATALLDAHGNGVVISSLYSRERVSVFAKPVVNGESEYDLSAEERQAIEKAQSAVR